MKQRQVEQLVHEKRLEIKVRLFQGFMMYAVGRIIIKSDTNVSFSHEIVCTWPSEIAIKPFMA
jgi:hypothetical protein